MGKKIRFSGQVLKRSHWFGQWNTRFVEIQTFEDSSVVALYWLSEEEYSQGLLARGMFLLSEAFLSSKPEMNSTMTITNAVPLRRSGSRLVDSSTSCWGFSSKPMVLELDSVAENAGDLRKALISSCKKKAHIYELGQELGKGGFSTVFRAKREGAPNSEEVAVKVVTFKAALGAAALKRQKEIILNEVFIMRKVAASNLALTGSHLVRLLDVYELKQPDRLCLAMELVEGGELFDRIVDQTKFSEKDAAELMLVLASVLADLHDIGVVHRDLKPENIVFKTKDPGSPLKLIDFGAAYVHGGSRPDLFKSALIGTPNYIAPEVLRKEYSPAVDVWSLGVILFALLCGYLPFDEKSEGLLFRKILKGDYEFHPKYWHDVSPSAKHLIKGMLTLNHTKRLTMKEVLEHKWVQREGRTMLKHRESALRNLKKLQRKRKFKGAVRAVIWSVRMGTASALQKQLSSEAHPTGLSLAELLILQTAFKEKHFVTRAQVEEKINVVLGEKFKDLNTGYIFDLLDHHSEGVLASHDLLLGLASCHSEETDAGLKFCFDLFAGKDDASISKNAFVKILQTRLSFQSSSNQVRNVEQDQADQMSGENTAQHVVGAKGQQYAKEQTLMDKLDAIFHEVDQNRDGMVSWAEFESKLALLRVIV